MPSFTISGSGPRLKIYFLRKELSSVSVALGVWKIFNLIHLKNTFCNLTLLLCMCKIFWEVSLCWLLSYSLKLNCILSIVYVITQRDRSSQALYSWWLKPKFSPGMEEINSCELPYNFPVLLFIDLSCYRRGERIFHPQLSGMIYVPAEMKTTCVQPGGH